MSNSANPYAESHASTADEPSVDELFDVLSQTRRRTVLSILTERQSAMDVSALADEVAARETDAAPATLSESTVHEIKVTLHHVHLPKLDDVELVDYDRDDRTVTTTNTTDAVPIDIE